MDIHLLGPTQSCTCKARHVCQSCQGQDTVNAKLLAALERAQWFIHDNICAPGDVEDCMQEVCNVAHDAIEEANK